MTGVSGREATDEVDTFVEEEVGDFEEGVVSEVLRVQVHADAHADLHLVSALGPDLDGAEALAHATELVVGFVEEVLVVVQHQLALGADHVHRVEELFIVFRLRAQRATLFGRLLVVGDLLIVAGEDVGRVLERDLAVEVELGPLCAELGDAVHLETGLHDVAW